MDVADFAGLKTAAAAAQSHIDQINLMCYDLQGNDGYSWYHASIDNTSTFSLSCKMEFDRFTAAGIPANKLGYGIPFYAYTYTGVPRPWCQDALPPATKLN